MMQKDRTEKQRFIQNQFEQLGIIPVLKMEDPGDVPDTAEALLQGGLPAAEITFRTPGAAEAIRRMRDYPDILLGAGTVLETNQVRQAKQAGAEFIVSPGLNTKVVEACFEEELPVFPGVCTPTEIEQALSLGLSALKFFPAEVSGGKARIKAFQGPYPSVRWIPTGGITADNLRGYLDLPSVLACGGSWMVPPGLIRSGDQNSLAEAIAQAAFLASGLRPGRILCPRQTEPSRALTLLAALLGIPLIRRGELSEPSLAVTSGDSRRSRSYLERRLSFTDDSAHPAHPALPGIPWEGGSLALLLEGSE